MIETAIDPRQPRRLEKKANMLPLASEVTANAAVQSVGEREDLFRRRNHAS